MEHAFRQLSAGGFFVSSYRYIVRHSFSSALVGKFRVTPRCPRILECTCACVLEFSNARASVSLVSWVHMRITSLHYWMHIHVRPCNLESKCTCVLASLNTCAHKSSHSWMHVRVRPWIPKCACACVLGFLNACARASLDSLMHVRLMNRSSS